MKALLLAFFLGTSSFVVNNETTVYISTGKTAYAYHARSTCRTLSRSEVISISLAKAKSMGRKPCKVCYR